jgi:hypothetical protein
MDWCYVESGKIPSLSRWLQALLWSSGVMPVHLAAVEKVVTHHTPGEQKKHRRQDDN